MAVVQNYLPGDSLLIDKIVYELKSQGIFDQFRKECIADVDTKPAYQNLRQRVEGSVSGFLNKQNWSSDMNKNQLREMLRKNIYESGFLETGVERIVDQVVNPKINSIFLPKVTEVVYKFLGIEKLSADKKENLKPPTYTDNLLPTDLEAVSPESEKKFDVSNDSQNLDDSKIDEDESPPFEPLEEKPAYVPAEENSVDSHLSGFSGLMSHDSNHSQEFSKPIQMEVSNQDSLLSKQSSEGHLSIVMSDDNDTKMEICEDSQQQKALKVNDTKTKNFDIVPEISDRNTSPLKKTEEKVKSDRSGKSYDKHKSRHDSKSDRKDDKDKKSNRDRKDHKDRHSSKDKGKEKDRKDSKSGSSKSDKSEKNTKSDSKSEKDRNKSSSSSSSNRHSSTSKDKDKSSSSSKKEHSSSSRDRGDIKDKSKSSSSKDKDSKHKDKDEKSKSNSKSNSKHESRSDKHKKEDKHRSDKHRSSSSKDKDRKDSKKDKKESKDDHFNSKKKSDRRSTDRDSNDGQSGLKSSSSSFDSYASSQTLSKSQESSNSNSNTGSGDSGNSDAIENFSNDNALISILNDKVEGNEENILTSPNKLSHVTLPTLKLIKPKFASNIHEARRLMKIRKQLSLLEKQNILDITQLISKKIMENKLKSENNKIGDKPKNNIEQNKQINNTKVQNVNSMVQQKANNKLDHKVRNEKKLGRKTKKKRFRNLYSEDSPKKNNCVIVCTSPKTAKVEEVIPAPLSPPLKSSVVSAATWDALEAKLHQSLNYSTSYEIIDGSENIEFKNESNTSDKSEKEIEKSTKSESKTEDDCLYLELDSKNSRTQRYMRFSSKYIANLQNTIDKRSNSKVTNKIHFDIDSNHTNKGLKRKYSGYQSDLKNNNKKFNTHHIEVHENFTLPLSPAESDNSIDKKSDTSETSIKSAKKTTTEFMEKVKKTVRAPAKTQRYSSEDLYKPRPFFSGSRRRSGRNTGID